MSTTKRARLDRKGTAKPKTRLVGKPTPSGKVGPGLTRPFAIEDTETGERTPLAAGATYPRDARTKTTEHIDDGFVRTALVIDPRDTECGSIDLVDLAGVFLARINIGICRDKEDGETLIVDTIDVAKRYTKHMACAFPNGMRTRIDGAGPLVSADFRGGK